MSPRPLSFKLDATDHTSQARAGVISTPHGPFKTPIFMPVGTQGAVRNLTPDHVVGAGAQIILANTYHMSIRPGEDLVKKAGGLHKFMGYNLPILTDSGGFQVFSLPKTHISDEGVRFQYEVNGQEILLNPERSMQIQQALGADIAMVFDECAPFPCSYEYAVESLERTTRWEARSKAAHTRPDQALFGIVQGSMFADLRRRSAREIINIGFDGYAIGGLSVGEGLETMCKVLDWVMPELPELQPRYLMGVGLPEDMLAAVERGVDMMDCVIPTRHARGGILYTFQGRMRIQHARYRRDLYPIDTSCTCYTCKTFSRAYLRHLFMIREVLATALCSIHNIHFYLQLMGRARQAILENRFSEFKRAFLEQYKPGDGIGEKDDDDAAELLDEHDEKGMEEPPRKKAAKSTASADSAPSHEGAKSAPPKAQAAKAQAAKSAPPKAQAAPESTQKRGGKVGGIIDKAKGSLGGRNVSSSKVGAGAGRGGKAPTSGYDPLNEDARDLRLEKERFEKAQQLTAAKNAGTKSKKKA
ncbi:MAG: tRNA guanosine(34) transglycosylase Tgt [Myxococcota bacterium]